MGSDVVRGVLLCTLAFIPENFWLAQTIISYSRPFGFKD